MNKFLKKVFVFLLPIIVLSYPLDFFISHFLKRSSKFSAELEVMNDIYNSTASSDVLIYGSSRAWVHINPETISDSLNLSAYNFGVNGHNFWIQYLRHLEYLKHNEKPKLIILSLDMFTLDKREDLYNAEQFLPYMLWNKNIRTYTKSFIGYNSADYTIPLLRYFGKDNALKISLDNIKNNEQKKIRNRGYAGKDKKWSSDLNDAKLKQEGIKSNVDSLSVVLFEQFIKECKSENIELVLVYSPEYIEGQKYVTNRNEVIDIFKSFGAEYNLTFLDYSNDSLSMDRNLFYNSLHLNKQGAELFSAKLAHDLKLELKKNPL